MMVIKDHSRLFFELDTIHISDWLKLESLWNPVIASITTVELFLRRKIYSIRILLKSPIS